MKKNLIALMMYLGLFAIIFFVALYNYNLNKSIVDIGFSAKMTNIGLMALSAIGIVKSFLHIHLH